MTTSVSCLVIGDPHFKEDNILESDQFTEKTLSLVSRNSYHFAVLLGDILHTHDKIHVVPFTRAINFIEQLSRLVKVFLLIGNHDMSCNSAFLPDEHPFVGLKNWSNVVVVNKGWIEEIGGLTFTFVPYTYPGRFEEALRIIYHRYEKDYDKDLVKTRAIFAHQEFSGAKMGAKISTQGDPWSLDNPLVISGHIHDYDHLQENIFYVGTPFQHAFGDKSDKTLSHFIFNENGYEHDRISLDMNKREIIYLDATQVDEYFPVFDRLIKIVIRGTPPELKILSHNSKIEEWKKAGIKVVYKPYKDTRNNSTDKKGLLAQKQKPFNDFLREKLENNKELYDLFREIC